MTKKKPTTKSNNFTGRKCSVCTSGEVDKINSQIAKGISFRCISLTFGMSDMSVGRHTNNCLNLEIAALIKEKRIEKAINHYEEITEQLEFAKDLRIAARKYLSDPETGELVLIPRSDEIDVVFEDYSDRTPQGAPKKKTESLDTLLERAEAGNIAPIKTITKHVDIRSFALNAINTVDTVLDKIAKKEGLYQQERQNETDAEFARIKKVIESAMEKFGTDYRTELDIFLKNYADQVRPDLKEKLISEMVN